MEAKETLTALFDRALTQEIGVGIKTKNQKAFANELFSFRKDRAEYAELMIFQPNNGEVWLVKKRTEVP